MSIPRLHLIKVYFIINIMVHLLMWSLKQLNHCSVLLNIPFIPLWRVPLLFHHTHMFTFLIQKTYQVTTAIHSGPAVLFMFFLYIVYISSDFITTSLLHLYSVTNTPRLYGVYLPQLYDHFWLKYENSIYFLVSDLLICLIIVHLCVWIFNYLIMSEMPFVI